MWPLAAGCSGEPPCKELASQQAGPSARATVLRSRHCDQEVPAALLACRPWRVSRVTARRRQQQPRADPPCKTR
eukprot:3716595-Heterocapsa_arctica.AAC.1